MAGPDYYNIFADELQARAPKLTDRSDGSIVDVLAGSFQTALQESDANMELRFAKTLIGTAHGPEITGGPDDLQTLLVDHYGEDFRRPDGQLATGVVKFSRANTDKGIVAIPKGTAVLSRKNVDLVTYRFKTKAAAVLVGLEILVEVEASDIGPLYNIDAVQIQSMEGALADPSIVVSNPNGFGGGTSALDDTDYRKFALDLLASKQGSTTRAVKAKAKSVTGIVFAEAVERIITAKEWSIADEDVVGDYFKILKVDLYVADTSGTASPTLVAKVKTAIDYVRAAGILVSVVAAEAVALNWKTQIVLNPSGPNYATLSNDTTLISDAMESFLNSLVIGQSFNKTEARDHMMAIFGPAGTGDLTDFFTLLPATSVATAVNQKIIPGTCEVG